MPVLFCLTLVRTLTGASVHHDARRDGMGHHDRQTMHVHGVSDEQGRDVEPSLLTSTGSDGPAWTRRSWQPSLSFFSFSSVVTRAFPSPIKGKAGHPMKGDPDRHKIEQRDKSARAVIELSAPIHSFHQRLGILSLSRLSVTPTANQVPIT